MRQRLWWPALAGGIAATGAYFALPRQGLAQNLAYNAIGLVFALAMVAGVRLFRPARPALWYLFAAGQLLSVGGDVVWEVYQYVLHRSPYPSPADVLYLGCYPLLAAGLVLLTRERRGRDESALIDSAIVATGLCLVFGLFVLQPIAATSDGTALERLISVAYPVADALLLIIVARLYTGSARRTASDRLLGVAALLLLAGDIVFAVLTQYSSYEGGNQLDALFLMSYVLWGTAALHPSMAERATAATPSGPARVGLVRLAALTAVSLLAPAMLFVPAVMRNGADRAAVGVGAILLFLLVAARMAGFVRRVQKQAGLLEDLAMHDELTGQANRRHFLLRLEHALAAGRPAVVRLNVNDFKRINDQLGHAVGDRLLAVLGAKIAATAGEPAMVARIGGDEFAVLLPDAAGTPAVVERLVAAFDMPVEAGGHHLLVRTSIGIAEAGDTTQPSEMLRRADLAVTASRGSGTPCRFTPELDHLAHEEATVGAELRTALEAGQFRLVFQPIVELPHGRVVAVETLVRWEHPRLGTVSPAVFIPIAERNGLIVELGAWILREACRRAAATPHAPERISVNVSPRQLAHPDLVTTVVDALTASGLPASRLTIEVTETAVFDGGPAIEALHQLRALGIKIALDDFGTGHSSLTLLRTVPAQVLKVDKSFVDEITAAGESAVIARGLIEIADGLGMSAVAEGVETAEQADVLYQLGYRLAQGYYFGRPAATMPEPALMG
jgi:diguanylate cyclase (GGDEF)-like protein